MLRRLLPLLLLALVAPSAAADVVRLRTGESVKCRLIQERSDERTLVVEDLLSGTVREFAWEAVDPLDRARIRVEWNIDERGSARTTRGHRFLIRLAGDETEEIYGLKEKEDATQVHVRVRGNVTAIEKSRIVEWSEEVMDPRDIWTADQLMERYAQELAQQDPPADLGSTDGMVAFKIGDYAEWAGALTVARDAFRRAGADPDYGSRLVAENRATRVESLIRDKQAMDAIRDLKTKLSSNLFLAVRKGLADFETNNQGASEAVLKALTAFRDDVAKRRDKHFRQMARSTFHKLCVKLIETKVREKDLKLSEAKSWARKELPEAAFAALTARMETKDEVTPMEARAYWDTRWEGVTKSGWHRTSYGSGSLIPYPGKLLPPKPKPPPKNAPQQQGPAPKVTLPKAPTPDQWWAKAGPERVPWLMAHFVQTSGLFEVSDDLEKAPCVMCAGKGIITKSAQTGELISYICDRCGGTQADYTVKFR